MNVLVDALQFLLVLAAVLGASILVIVLTVVIVAIIGAVIFGNDERRAGRE